MPHVRNGCELCSTLTERAKGRRPSKRKFIPRGRAAEGSAEEGKEEVGVSVSAESNVEESGDGAVSNSKTKEDVDHVMGSGMDVPFTEVLTKATASYKSDLELSPTRFMVCFDEVVCRVCRLVADQAVETPCC